MKKLLVTFSLATALAIPLIGFAGELGAATPLTATPLFQVAGIVFTLTDVMPFVIAGLGVLGLLAIRRQSGML